MRTWFFPLIVIGAISTYANGALATELCITSPYSVQAGVDSQGNLRLYVYSQQFGGSNYLTYSGNNDVAKAFHAQLLYAQATGQTACVAYTAGSPSHIWNLSSVGIAVGSGWPYQ